MSNVSFSWAGMDAELKLTKAIQLGLLEAGHEVLMYALPNTPLDEGPLRESAQLLINGATMSVGQNDGIPDQIASPNALTPEPRHQMVIGYDTPYALKQHEELSYNHAVGEAKFLENAFNAVDVKGIIATKMSEVMKW